MPDEERSSGGAPAGEQELLLPMDKGQRHKREPWHTEDTMKILCGETYVGDYCCQSKEGHTGWHILSMVSSTLDGRLILRQWLKDDWGILTTSTRGTGV